MKGLLGGIEAGGTKFVCAVGRGPDDYRAEVRFPTTTPDETIARAVAFFKEQAEVEPLEAMGIASFGPVDLNPHSLTYGYITTTPKTGWQEIDLLGRIKAALGLPTAFDTDVNAAALAEYRWSRAAERDVDPLVYMTIGTGIGIGVIANGQPIHGLVHPEGGHILLRHDHTRDPFEGSCPYHGDCFEGLASGPAMQKRWGEAAESLPIHHPAWELEAQYIAEGLENIICIVSPRRIVLGGGVMQQAQLFPMIREKVLTMLNKYVDSDLLLETPEHYIIPASMGNRVGTLGAFALAEKALKV